MKNARARILTFRARYPNALEWSQKIKTGVRPMVDTLYRDCQQFAVLQINKTVDDVFSNLGKP